MKSFFERVEHICGSSGLPLVELETGSSEGSLARFAWSPSSGVSLDPGRRFLVASITKPIIATLAVKFAESGMLGLNDRVHRYLEEFDNSTFRRITIRHLLTHTSGLPDMLPENTQLRADHAELPAYVTATSRCSPDFAPGTECRYSSMGFALLGRILELLSGKSLRDVSHELLFSPLKMDETWLGLEVSTARESIQMTVPCELPIWQSAETDWNWNSIYWRTLGAPWGGLISTAADLGRFARMILLEGQSPDGSLNPSARILSSMAVDTMCAHQTQLITGLPHAIAAIQRWGLGWRLNWPDHAASFGDFVSHESIGHWGATGTLLWIDRQRDRYCVILTPQPYEQSADVIQRLSNLSCSI